MPKEFQNERARKPSSKRPHLRAPPNFTFAPRLGPHYCRWYLVHIRKSYRLCTGLSDSIQAHRHDCSLSSLKPYLDEWETELLTWLEEPWLTNLTVEQLEAIYSVLFNLAEEVFKLNAFPDGEKTCEAAVQKTVRFMNHMPWYEP